MLELLQRRDLVASSRQPAPTPASDHPVADWGWLVADELRLLPSQTLRELWAATIPGVWPRCPADVTEALWDEFGRQGADARRWLVAVCRETLAMRGEA